MIERYVSPSELRRLLSALLVVCGFISIAALFGFLVVPGTRNVNRPDGTLSVDGAPGNSGWLDPAEVPVQARKVLPPIDPATVMTPNPDLTARGQALYASTCATCHGPQGRGDGPGALGLKPKPRDFTAQANWTKGHRLDQVFQTLESGIPGTSMVSYNYLSKRDRMALAHVVQGFAAFQRGPEDPQALAALAKLFASAGEVIPNRIPLTAAQRLLVAESSPVPALPADPRLAGAVQDPGRAAQVLAGIPRWREDGQALAKGVLAGLPGNGFAPAVLTYGPAQWNDLRNALAGAAQ